MAEPASARNWGGQLSWLAIVILIMFVNLLPLNTLPRSWAGPDLLLVVTLVWIARRPEFVPAPMVAVVFLLADLVFQRPPGLMAALVLILTEMLRARSVSMRQLPLTLEWASIALGIVIISLIERMVLALTLIPQPPFSLSLMEAVSTALVYPIVVLLAYLVFGISRPAPGEVDSLGHRL
ncbi:rod shape-determining protein MreD [Ponticoccus sp. SC2-23]|uniref:rod shape-determining protein MreD n=1 Tax=Alexandriicola marinus TaxID=2081710 RepID=UPI000FD85EBC|nr:rod shape-determining protein MreD [Alexandriicola marinus]MBM1219728.1 rod shape-determining protein MreD [Ponticoccus sp. SC6-9]MBM1223200.1 rod shape-determining protein MreD [Ponticoccus sp. SC6-15]MBM1229541.1 rod shape-determining protein MreD [Ponticoccus sp. SC6-38]MBM1232166.1 rod shape-determining protein MreD [Ponticoccus sp. SC6-45]MBM1237884.1 rod shape-determining protein MreD [Ponticoccus sp. SC6-49]MBM1241177.1 rod shape-determining protein MreD [Ponticoccus sp. SC2-64]MBM